jgi:hypothetical protein
MAFPWFSHGFPTVFPWFSHGLPIKNGDLLRVRPQEAEDDGGDGGDALGAPPGDWEEPEERRRKCGKFTGNVVEMSWKTYENP